MLYDFRRNRNIFIRKKLKSKVLRVRENKGEKVRKYMSKKYYMVIAIIIAVMIIASTTLWYYYNVSPPESTIRIGVIGPFTGPYSRTGEEMKRGSILAVEEVNAKGGIMGMKVELFFEDSESKPEVGVSAFEKLVTRDRIHVLAGCYHSSVTLAVMDRAAEHKIPFINALSLSEEIAKKIRSDPEKYKYVFHVELNSTGMALSERAFIQDIVEAGIFTPKTKTISIICEDTDYGRSAASAFKERMEEIGWTVVSEDYWSLGTTDFSSIITKIETLNPDVIYSAGGGTDAARLVSQLHDLGVKKLIVGESFTLFPEFFDMVGEKGIGLIDFIQTPEATPVGKNFTQRYIEKFDQYPTYTAGAQYDCVMIALRAIERAGSLDPDAIVEALLQTDYRGFLTERVVFNPVSHEAIFGPGYRVFSAVQIQKEDGELKLFDIWPFTIASRPILKTWEDP